MRHVCSGLLIALFAAGLYGAAPPETDEMLAQLSKIRLDKTQIYNIRDITIRRDVFSITFTRGTIAFLEPVNGKVTGAVFLGSGDIVAIPPDAVEKQQLFRFTRSPLLTESFDTGFFRFTDDTYEEILKEYRDRAQEDVTPDERESLLPFEDELGAAEGALNYRIVSDFLSTSNRPLFWAQLRNDKYGWFSATYDQRLAEEVSISKTFEATAELEGVWASFNRRSEARDPEAAAIEEQSPIDIQRYAIATVIGNSPRLESTATIRFVPRWDGERVVSFYLSPFLTVSAVTSANGEALPFHQKEGFTDAEVQKIGRNHFIVVMPEPMPAGAEIAITVAYAGEVLRRATGDLAYVGDRGIWYPATDTADRANFDLTFQGPDGFPVVSSSGEGRVSAFMVGDVSLHTDASNSAPLTVAVSKDPGVVYRDTDEFRPLTAAPPPAPAPPPPVPAGPRRNRTRDVPVIVLPPAPVAFNYGIDTNRFGDAMLREVRANVQFLEGIFGKYPFEKLTAAPMTVGFREGTPGFLALRSISFLDEDQRRQLNVPAGAFARAERVRAADIAHQWLGHSVNWKGYRDQWVFEALSEYGALLYLEDKYKNGRLIQELNRARAGLDKAPGPVWIGQRLSGRADAEEYLRILEDKGAWIMHMLRAQMGDAAFFALTREFAEQFAGKAATTFDFKRLAEKHMNADLDSFFDAWVFGAAVPTYALVYKVEPDGTGFVVSGKISQSGVPDTFQMAAPIFADGQLLGRVTVSGDEGEFRFTSSARPQRVELDIQSTVLFIPAI